MRMIEAAFDRSAALKTSRGYVAETVMWPWPMGAANFAVDMLIAAT